MRVASRLRADLDSRTRLLVVIGSLAAYAVAFAALYPSIQEVLSPLFLLPLVAACWAYGLRGGIIMGLLALPFNGLLMIAKGGAVDTAILMNRSPSFAAAIVVGVVVGWLFDMRDQLQEELEKRQRAETREREQDAFADALRSVSTALNDTLDSQEVFDRILKHLDRVAPHDAARIVLIENGQVKLARQDERTQAGQTLRLPVEDADNLLRLAESGHAGSIDWPTEQLDVAVDGPRAQSCVAVPISLAGRAIGFLILYSRRTGVFFDTHVERLQTFADQAAIAIRNAQMYDALESNVTELETLYNATSVLLTAGNMDDIARQIVQAVALHIETADCAVWLLEEDSDQIVCTAHVGPHDDRSSDVLHVDDRGPVQEALQKNQPVYIPNFARDPRYALDASDIRSELVIPLKGQSDIVGVLDLRSAEVDAFSTRDQRILTAFAERATIAIDNMRLYDTIHQFAIDREEQVIERTAELNRAKERVEAILNSSSDTIILTLPEGQIQQSNRAFYDLFGYQIDEEFNWMIAWLMADDSQQQVTDALNTARDSRRPQRLEITASRKDGSHFEADLVLSPIHERVSGGCWGIVCSLRDISERKRMEQELREALAKERELRELKSRFISMASHEFRTPLATINATASLLRNYFDRMDEAKKERQFEKIEQQINYMTGLLNDVLTIGRMEAGKTPVDLVPIYLHEFFEEMAEEFHQTQPNHQLMYRCQGDPRALMADSKLMREILSNLLTNAAKYSPDGTTVHVDLDYRLDEVMFTVRDEGIGIPEKDQAHLFEAFHRAENVGTTPGTGLGLSIVKHAVDIHGGTIDVHSKINEGTTFTVRIPLELSKGQVS